MWKCEHCGAVIESEYHGCFVCGKADKDHCLQVTETSEDKKKPKNKLLGISLLFCLNLSIGFTFPLVVAKTVDTYLGFMSNATQTQQMVGSTGLITYCIIWYPVNSFIMKKWLSKHEAYWLLALLFLVLGLFVIKLPLW